MEFGNGDKYEGSWDNSKGHKNDIPGFIQNHGVMIFKNGEKYTGNW